jgi:hypothetical protein
VPARWSGSLEPASRAGTGALINCCSMTAKGQPQADPWAPGSRKSSACPGSVVGAKRLCDSTVPADGLRAEAPDHAWAIEFQSDQAATGHDLKLSHVVDELTRERRRIGRPRRIDAEITVATFDRFVARRPTAPMFICCDSGPETTANALRGR